MTEPIAILKTSIRPKLLKKHLISSVTMGSIGILLLILALYTIPQKPLKFLGPVIILAWIIIGISWIRPYAMLKKISLFPDQLIIRRGTLLYKNNVIPFEAIRTVHFINEGDTYGLKFDLVDKKSLFLPYFTKKSFEELRTYLVTKR